MAATAKCGNGEAHTNGSDGVAFKNLGMIDL